MKDLDFDELDQAVSSVLGANADPKKDDAPVDKTDAADAKAENSESKTDEKPKEEEKAPAATPAASPAVRRRGQFLDMVHPSADMTSRLPVTSPAARKQLSPVSSDISSLKPTPTPTPAEVSKAEDTTPVTETTPEVEKTDAPKPDTLEKPTEESNKDEAKKSDDVKWPDPLDLAGPTEPEIPATVPDRPDESSTDKPADPSSTPFVPDVKVDKRPLGSPVPTTEVTPETVPAEIPVAVPTETVPDEEQKAPVITPPELQPDVVSVEAAADREFAPDGTDTETSEDANKGMAQSIPQQYKTPDEKPDTATHPVFDTKEYHQPLLPAHSKKKSKGWLIVLIILGLLVVGSVLGYVAYMAGL